MRNPRALLLGSLLLVALAVAGVRHWRTRNLGAVERGSRVAASRGCFACHGPGGVTGLPDAGDGIGAVPAFAQEDVRGYAENEGEIREWILDGMPRRIRQELGPDDESTPLLRMPEWRGVLSEREVDDLVAYVKAVSDYDPIPEGDVAAGRAVALAKGCFGCHGPQGRGAPPNPGSLKGYIPSWDGADFPELARDQGEIREWILDGSSKRLHRAPGDRDAPVPRSAQRARGEPDRRVHRLAAKVPPRGMRPWRERQPRAAGSTEASPRLRVTTTSSCFVALFEEGCRGLGGRWRRARLATAHSPPSGAAARRRSS